MIKEAQNQFDLIEWLSDPDLIWSFCLSVSLDCSILSSHIHPFNETSTLAPQAMAHSAIPSWSVDTQTESNFPNSSIVWRDQLIRGLDPRGTRFFKGIPLLPPLARTRPSSKIQYNYSLVRLILVFTNGCKMWEGYKLRLYFPLSVTHRQTN